MTDSETPIFRSRMVVRGTVFTLASLSLACLLGHFYGLWTMRFFGCWVLPPASAVLVWIAYVNPAGARLWIVQGAIGGVVAALAYDLYRLPYVLNGTPLFKVFPAFGRMLMGQDDPAWAAQALGWLYHFSNGASLGIMFLAMAWRVTPRALFWGAVAWALVVECLLLLTPYTRFFGLPLSAWFLFLTASAHLVFGIALGLWCRWRVAVA